MRPHFFSGEGIEGRHLEVTVNGSPLLGFPTLNQREPLCQESKQDSGSVCGLF